MLGWLEPSNINVSYGENVVCTFKNRLSNAGTITILKDTQPDRTWVFGFLTSGPGMTGHFCMGEFVDSPSASGVPSEREDLAVRPGSSYSVSEDSDLAWDNTAATCSDGSPVSAIDVSPNEDVTCTFVNRPRPTLTVILNASPDDPQDFAFAVNGPSARNHILDDDFFERNGLGSSPSSYVAPGNYSVSMTPVQGWTSSATCSDGSQVSAIDLQYGENVTCTFTVEPQDPGSLTLELDAVPNAQTSFTFRVAGGSFYPGILLQDNGDPSDGINNEHTFPVRASHYSVFLLNTNPQTNQVSQLDAECSDGSPISDIDISAGEHVTCRLIYGFQPTITVVQDTQPNDGQDFSYTGAVD